MKNTCYVAVDIGASSGRLMMGSLTAEDKMLVEEIHRFKNGFKKSNQLDRWDMDHLIFEILTGLEKIKRSGIEQCYAGIDTWAVDYCLIDSDGKLMAQPVSYRDDRTDGTVQKFAQRIGIQELYRKTGIQIQPFNTVFQLFEEEKETLQSAKKLLMIPDYLGCIFTGKAVTEKTNASTTQLLNISGKDWDLDLLNVIGVSRELFAPLVDSGTILGQLQKDWFTEFDLPDATFITVASHDTASAVAGTPVTSAEWAYISSGTWSLLGMEAQNPITTMDAFKENYTNEWGHGGTVRFLKNIMGMWLIQEVARHQHYRYSYGELAELASAEPAFQQFVDVNDDRFLNPDNMIKEIQAYCMETGQSIPKTPGELARCIYDNLALCYADELEKLQMLTGVRLKKVHIVGGGSNNHLLNQITADVSGSAIEAGPAEATAIGNIAVQLLATQARASLDEVRKTIKNSFALAEYLPRDFDRKILKKYQKFIKEVKQ